MSTAGLSYRHKKVQRLRRLLRQPSLREAEGCFAVEGVKLLEEALAAGAAIEAIFVAPGYRGPEIEIAEQLGLKIHYLAPGVIERVATTVTPQAVIAVVGMPEVTSPVPKAATSVVVLADVRDPGNAGTILRSAEASGMAAAVFAPGSVDPFNPKTARASAGAIFHMPMLCPPSMEAAFELLSGFQLLGTAADGDADYFDVDLTNKCAIVMGNEACGLSQQWRQHLDKTLSIPIVGRSESLNVSMAMTVIAFEAARQRRCQP